MRRPSAILLMVLAAVFVAVPAAAQDQRFALRFGFVLVEPKDDTFDTQGGFEVDFEWYFAPRVGFEVASLGSANADFDYNGDRVTGLGFSTFTVGINGHVVRTEKADFGLGVFGGRATYTDFEFEDSSGRWDAEGDTVYGAQAFVDMTVGRKWAVNLGLRYIDTQLELDSSNELDFSPIVLRVMGVYRWGRYKKSQSP